MLKKMEQWGSKFVEGCKRIKGLRSLRARIFVIILVVGCLPGVLLRYGIMQNYEQHAIELRTNTVQTQLKILANHLIHYNYLQDNSSEVIGAELDMLSNLYDGMLLSSAGTSRW